ncbi:hypothetical protein HP548_02990 [Paenibacillus taichungensis]|uniref:Uncharacterized protein n=1 Tax=Paenibacillus taichungensis TaxID=484184 RepID=A0ABX2MDP1_9BACL|nr:MULTISPECIES: hypothetical protein [Paenibacillus]NUU53063.1 hypothetical protein [Paenibacillus taichungensis]PIH58274.1 hypothetical protein CS562_17545 [Paenibacillus sp. LK1]
MNRIVTFLRDFAEDYLVLLGVLLINLATYRISVTAGLYCTGGFCLVAGVLVAFMARLPPRRTGGD